MLAVALTLYLDNIYLNQFFLNVKDYQAWGNLSFVESQNGIDEITLCSPLLSRESMAKWSEFFPCHQAQVRAQTSSCNLIHSGKTFACPLRCFILEDFPL